MPNTNGVLISASMILATVGMVYCGTARAEDARPATQAAATAPATAPATQAADGAAKVSPEARALLDQMKAAYADLKSLTLDGTVTANFDVAGKKQNESMPFKSSFIAPNQFRHEGDQVLAGSTGERLFIYHTGENAYLAKSLPVKAEKFKDGELIPAQTDLLSSQNPSLGMAVSSDASAALLAGMASAEKGADVTIDGKPVPMLELKDENGVISTVLVDPQTHLLRRVSHDLKSYFESQGVPDVKLAEVVVAYTTVETSSEAVKDQFAWDPPEGAREAQMESASASSGSDAPALALVGKPAPDFTLENLKGEKVTLSATKGSVVVLDFWATWCGPCVMSLPHLQQIAKDTEKDGVKVFAVNQQEDKDTVEQFMQTNQYTLSALLDIEGKTGEAFKVTGIPQTVVIGKDGTVRKVFIGAGPDTEQQIRDAIGAELK